MEYEKIITTVIVGIFYICLTVVLFAPSLYAGWFYYLSRKLAKKKPRKKMLQSVMTTFLINLALVYALYSLMFNYILPSQIQAKNRMAKNAIQSVEESQEEFYSKHGRYYMLGPVRGPYTDPHGLEVGENVIIQAAPKWTEDSPPEETFEAYAIHVWGNTAFVRKPDGTIKKLNGDSPAVEGLRSKLIRSVK
jgi:hypothetical protein